MNKDHENSKKVQKALLALAEESLHTERKNAFSNLLELKIVRATKVATFLGSLSSSDFDACVKTLVRRCKPKELLEWLGESLPYETGRLLDRLDDFCRPVDRVLLQIHPSLDRREKDRFLSSLVCEFQGETIVQQQLLKNRACVRSFVIETNIDFGHSGGMLSYIQHVKDGENQAITMTPFSILEWYGIGSQTLWRVSTANELSELRSVLIKQVKRLSELMAVIDL